MYDEEIYLQLDLELKEPLDSDFTSQKSFSEYTNCFLIRSNSFLFRSNSLLLRSNSFCSCKNTSFEHRVSEDSNKREYLLDDTCDEGDPCDEDNPDNGGGVPASAINK